MENEWMFPKVVVIRITHMWNGSGNAHPPIPAPSFVRAKFGMTVARVTPRVIPSTRQCHHLDNAERQ